MNNSKFPFADSPNTACFTCCHVLDRSKPILYICHDEDGYWQFLCGGVHRKEDARIVSLAEILSIDEEMRDFADLNYGEYAEAENTVRSWNIKHNDR